MKKFEPYKRALQDIGPIVARHLFILVNAIIFIVVVLLFFFGSKEAALFLGIIIFFNMMLGIIQDTRARIALEALQMLTALRVNRIDAVGKETSILAEEVAKGDLINLKLGDQVPCDGILESVNGLEVSEALLTGESDSFPRKINEKVQAGDIVTAGEGTCRIQTNFSESKMAQMTAEAKQYAAKPSPIQLAIERVIKYSGYILLVVLAFVILRGFLMHEAYIDIVLNAGALASIIVPQGLVVITTLLFAFGASSYSRRHVLFQEINATEKLGRIKNLCMDKTGTLTENFLVLEEMYVPEGISRTLAGSLFTSYINGTKESSQTIAAIVSYLGGLVPEGTILSTLPFSSWRQYGAALVRRKDGDEVILVGAPDVFLPHLSEESEQIWLGTLLKAHAHQGKRMLCMVRSASSLLPADLSGSELSLLAVFVFQSGLREGIRDAIKFFQDRGVTIRIISGDNVETVQAVARSAGVLNTEAAVTGTQMKEWKTPAAFDEGVHTHTIFARILPEQKVQIIESFKKDGFTAMVGDGANDALAIKKADLGIAMFDGAPATRRLAGIILMNNSFAALPGGVLLADNFIQNIEIFAGIFINQSVLGLWFFLIVSALGYPFPLTPLNITLINYFTVGIPGMLIAYWAVRPSTKVAAANSVSFLARVMPYVFYAAPFEAVAAGLVFASSPAYLKAATSNTLVALAFIVCGFVFFALAPSVYRGRLSKQAKRQVLSLSLIEIVLIGVALYTPLFVRFFNINPAYPSIPAVAQALAILLVFGLFGYVLTKQFFGVKGRK